LVKKAPSHPYACGKLEHGFAPSTAGSAPWFELPYAMAAGARATNAVVDLLHQSVLIQLVRR
jgi:hypothetical protein